MAKRTNELWGKVGLTAVGALVGAVVGIFSAPKSGKASRDEVVKGVKTVSKKASKTVAAAARKTKKVVLKK